MIRLGIWIRHSPSTMRLQAQGSLCLRVSCSFWSTKCFTHDAI